MALGKTVVILHHSSQRDRRLGYHCTQCAETLVPLTRVELERFTAFTHLNLDVSPGINILIGANGTGKTHLLKVGYAACDAWESGIPFSEKLARVMRPSSDAPGRLVQRSVGNSSGTATVHATVNGNNMKLAATFSRRNSRLPSGGKDAQWRESDSIQSVYIPVKEMLANAPGFRSLYAKREIHFEEIYNDILDRAYLPKLRGPIDQSRKKLLSGLQKAMGGSVNRIGEEFFLRNRSGNLEFTLLAEGLRKLGLLWLLIQNGTLEASSTLFWDEPEANMNPRLMDTLMDLLLQLQRDGIQVFIATHSYVVSKELDLRSKDGDNVMFHSLYREEDSGDIVCSTAPNFHDIYPNLIGNTFTDLYDREVRRSLGGLE